MFDFTFFGPFLRNPYSWGFVLFWVVMLVASTTLWILDYCYAKGSRKVESLLFWLFGLAMVVFIALRPIGIARDDLAYLDMFKAICPTLTCMHWLQGPRDMGWYSSVGLLKSIFPDPRVMLWVGAAGLLFKLFVMFSLVRRPLIPLLLFTALYYQVQDLTAWRVSLALALFMAAIWLVVRTRLYWNAWTLLICGLFHKQAFVAPLIMLGVFLRQHRFLTLFMSVLSIALLVLGLYPSLHLTFAHFKGGWHGFILNQGLDSYIVAKMSGVYSGWRQAPITVYPLVLLTLWLLFKAKPDNDKLDAILTGCLAMACLFLWAFASLPDAQVRFFEFFMVPTVLLLGTRRLSGLELSGVIFVSFLFVVKYNVVHQVILQSKSV